MGSCQSKGLSPAELKRKARRERKEKRRRRRKEREMFDWLDCREDPYPWPEDWAKYFDTDDYETLMAQIEVYHEFQRKRRLRMAAMLKSLRKPDFTNSTNRAETNIYRSSNSVPDVDDNVEATTQNTSPQDSNRISSFTSAAPSEGPLSRASSSFHVAVSV
jgi:hypothetical protein